MENIKNLSFFDLGEHDDGAFRLRRLYCEFEFKKNNINYLFRVNFDIDYITKNGFDDLINNLLISNNNDLPKHIKNIYLIKETDTKRTKPNKIYEKYNILYRSRDIEIENMISYLKDIFKSDKFKDLINKVRRTYDFYED